jgi:hypothetical protein
MLQSLSAFFYRIASWKTLLLGILLSPLIPMFVFGPLEGQFHAYAGYELGPIDLLFEFNPAKIQKMVVDYGPEGRAAYAQVSLIADTIYPFIYTFLFCIVLSLLFRRRGATSLSLLNLFPITGFFLDLLENACVITLLKSYPDPLPTIALLCSVMTNLKWAGVAITAIIAIYGLIQLVKRKSAAKELSV